jgi:hypothetical protein
LINVDFPAPFGPSRPIVRPVKEQVRSRSTSRFPSRTERPRSSITGGGAGADTGGAVPATEGRTVDVSLTWSMIQFLARGGLADLPGRSASALDAMSGISGLPCWIPASVPRLKPVNEPRVAAMISPGSP